VRLVSTRNPQHVATFTEALGRNLAPDGGLYTPEPVPRLADVDGLLALPWLPRCVALLQAWLGDEIDGEVLAQVAHQAFDFAVPLVDVPSGSQQGLGGVHALELFHGPTLAFKDFGARFLAGMLRWQRSQPGYAGGPRTILTATSGDTGAAVAHAFWQVPGFAVVVLYPRGRVSPVQERQFASLGDNVLALAVDGSFDDCQALAKACFADAELSAQLGLASANSIHVARLLAQALYTFEAVAQLRARGIDAPPVIAIPSGNFGNLCAGLLAQRMGLPVRAFVAATNANATVPEYLDTGVYRPRPSVQTLSNAMDVGAPSNWERIRHLFAGDLQALRQNLRWGSLSDAETTEVVRQVHAGGMLLDPHAAVAYGVLRQQLRPGEVGVLLATAHPGKFADVLQPIVGPIALPPTLQAVAKRPLLAEVITNDFCTLRARLLRLT
jgi:threonine synthase